MDDLLKDPNKIRFRADAKKAALVDFILAIAAGFYQLAIHTHLTKLIDHQGYFPARKQLPRQQMIQRRRFSGTQIAGQKPNLDRFFYMFLSHSLMTTTSGTCLIDFN